ncbi:MAG TPA: porin [Burkholderiaceae bacterium]|nr:porin [Burkholderiaceae bacterium]
MKSTQVAIARMALAIAGGGIACATAAQSVTLYGDVDEYVTTMHSSSGKSLTALEDGAFLLTRWGFRGAEPLAEGYATKFDLEGGIKAPVGAQKDSNRLFDRQAWVGVDTPAGEFRAGRQNTAIFYRGNYIDYTTRTLGSVVNSFGVPSRLDNDLAYLSHDLAGLTLEAHYAIPGVAGSTTVGGVGQAAADFRRGPLRIGYAGIAAKPGPGVTTPKTIVYHNVYGDIDYGRGTVYLAFVRSNNGAGALSNVSSQAPGTPPVTSSKGATTFYDVYQVSADYRISEAWRVGGLWGDIRDTSGAGNGMRGESLGSYYDLSKRTMVYGMLHRVRNTNQAAFVPVGSSGLLYNFSGADVTGQSIQGIAIGMVHRF